MLIHHGTLDESCPVGVVAHHPAAARSARASTRGCEIYAGEQHAFGPQWPLSMERTVRFLRRELRS